MLYTIQTFIENYLNKSHYEDSNGYAIKIAAFYFLNRNKNDENSFLREVYKIRTSFFRINKITDRAEFERTLMKILDKTFYKDLIDNPVYEMHHFINPKEIKTTPEKIITTTRKKIPQLYKTKKFWVAIGLIATIVACIFAIPGFINESRALISDFSITSSPTVILTQVTIGLSSTSSPTNSAINSPTPAKTSTTIDTVSNYGDISTLVITEIMANPCNGKSENEYIELYNSGDKIIDVNGLWISDGQETDQIVAFQTRYPKINIGYNTITNTTLLKSYQYAVLLAPNYPLVQGSNRMPYNFPKNTVILTTIDGLLLGDENNGIQVSNPDMIILYQGTNNVIDNLISSYGNPIVGSDPTSIKKSLNDNFPFPYIGNNCNSIERIFPNNEDNEKNWRVPETPSPGWGDYPLNLSTPTP